MKCCRRIGIATRDDHRACRVSLAEDATNDPEDDIKATYDKGILTVSVAVSEAAPADKHIAVQTAD